MFHSHWLRNWLGVSRSRKDRRREAMQRRKPVRLILESLEDRLTPSAPTQSAGSYTDLVNAVAADTAANTNYVIDITQSFKFDSGGQVAISMLGSGSTLTIEGQNGANYVLTGNGNRLFNVAKGQTVTFKDLKLTGGSGVASGGAIQDQGGNVTLSKMAVQGNTVNKGVAEGGGVSVSAGGNLIIKGGSTIQSNHALATGSISLPNGGGKIANGAQGGGLFVNAATVIISDSTISNNSAQGAQGANGATAGAAGSWGGSAFGGGMWVTGSGWNATLTGDTFAGNSVIGGAGGNGAAGRNASTSNPSGGNGGAGGNGGIGDGGAADFGGSGNLTILNDLAAPTTNPSLMIDNWVQGGAGGAGGAGGTSTGTANNSNGGDGGFSGFAGGGAIEIIAGNGTLTANIGSTTFYGNQASGGIGGAGGAAGTGGSGTAGKAGTDQLGGGASGGGLDLGLGQSTVTMVNNTVASNVVTGGAGGGSAGKGFGFGGGTNIADTATATLDNNTITQNSIQGSSGVGAGVAASAGSPIPATSGNPTLYNNLIQGNLSGSSADDMETFGTTLTNAANNFIGAMSSKAVSTSTNIVGNTQVQLGSVVGVDSKGVATGGPIYYPLLSGVKSIGAGTANVLSTIAGVEGTTSANAADEIGNPRASNNAINLGAVQSVSSSSTSAPQITIQPANQTGTAGSNVSFTAAASGNPTPTVQWQVSTDSGKTFRYISGATTTTLTLTNVTAAMNGNEFRAVFSNGIGTPATTDAATLTVTVHAVPPSPPPAPLPPPALHTPPLLAFFDNLLGGTETVNANGTETITDSLFGIPLLVSNFDSSGNLESVYLFGINVTLLFELL